MKNFKIIADISILKNIKNVKFIISPLNILELYPMEWQIDNGDDYKEIIFVPTELKPLNEVYSNLISEFIFSQDNEFISNIINERTLEKDKENGLLIISDEDIEYYNNMIQNMKELNESNNLYELIRQLQEYIINEYGFIKLDDNKFIIEEDRLGIAFRAYSNDYNIDIKYMIGDNFVSILRESGTNTNNDISYYIRDINFDKLKEEINKTFNTTFEWTRPDIIDPIEHKSELKIFVDSFLEASFSPNGFILNSPAFRYTFLNGVGISINKDEKIHINRNLASIDILNAKYPDNITNIHMTAEEKWKQLNRLDLEYGIRNIYLICELIKGYMYKVEYDKEDNIFQDFINIIYNINGTFPIPYTYSNFSKLPDMRLFIEEDYMCMEFKQNDNNNKYIFKYNGLLGLEHISEKGLDKILLRKAHFTHYKEVNNLFVKLKELYSTIITVK